MHRYVLVSLLLFGPLAARGEEPKLKARVRMIQLFRIEALEERCGNPYGQIYACTHFVGERLSAGCTQGGAGWSMRPRAEYVALMYLLNRVYIKHESLHLQDVENAVDDYLMRLEEENFESLQACQDVAKATEAAFSAKMRLFAATSNGARH